MRLSLAHIGILVFTLLASISWSQPYQYPSDSASERIIKDREQDSINQILIRIEDSLNRVLEHLDSEARSLPMPVEIQSDEKEETSSDEDMELLRLVVIILLGILATLFLVAWLLRRKRTRK